MVFIIVILPAWDDGRLFIVNKSGLANIVFCNYLMLKFVKFIYNTNWFRMLKATLMLFVLVVGIAVLL